MVSLLACFPLCASGAGELGGAGGVRGGHGHVPGRRVVAGARGDLRDCGAAACRPWRCVGDCGAIATLNESTDCEAIITRPSDGGAIAWEDKPRGGNERERERHCLCHHGKCIAFAWKYRKKCNGSSCRAHLHTSEHFHIAQRGIATAPRRACSNKTEGTPLDAECTCSPLTLPVSAVAQFGQRE